MKIREGFFLIFVFALSALMPDYASAAPQISARVSSSELLFEEESLLLTLDVDWLQAEENYTFVLPAPPVKNLILKRQGESQETYQKGEALWARKTFVFEFTPETPGMAKIESFSFNYVEPETGTPGTLQVPAFDVKVRKKGLPQIVLLLIPAVAGLLAARLFLYFRKRTAQRNTASVSQLSMEDRAAQALRQLPAISSQEESLAKGGVVYQSYLVEKFQMGSVSFDLGELTQRLEAKGLDALEIKKSRQLVEKLREARYSGVPFSASEVKELLEESASWIERRKVIGTPASSSKS